MTTSIPRTRDEAIAQLVEQDVARWGEAEREASERLHRGNYGTYGLALNALAARAELAESAGWRQLRDAAAAALTADDWIQLRRAG